MLFRSLQPFQCRNFRGLSLPSNQKWRIRLFSQLSHPQVVRDKISAFFQLWPINRYQFNPDLYNPDVVINILIKALTSSPQPDFNLCISLLDERLPNTQLDEPDPIPSVLPLLKTLHNLLYRCRFPAFWSTYRSGEFELLRDNYTVEVAGFENAVRTVVIRAVRATFTRISSERLSSYLDIEKGNSMFAQYITQF